MSTPQQLIIELIEAGYRQTEICRDTGLPRSTVSRLARGENGSITFERMDALRECHKRLLRKAKRNQDAVPA